MICLRYIKPLKVALSVLGGLVLPLGMVAGSAMVQAQQGWQGQQPHVNADPGRAMGQANADRINKIIQGLTPDRHSSKRPKKYRKKIRKIITYRKGHKHTGRPIIVNFNHSVDLSVYFAFNSTAILPAAQPVLDDLGYALNSRQLRFACPRRPG